MIPRGDPWSLEFPVIVSLDDRTIALVRDGLRITSLDRGMVQPM